MRKLLLILSSVAIFATHLSAFGSIDSKVSELLKVKNIDSSPICSDEVFLRRTYLVAAGRLPSIDESRDFLASKSKKRREELIDKIISSDDFVNMQSLKWGDLLKVKSEFPSNIWPNGAQAYNRWIRVHMRDNTPYDEFVRDLLLASGSNFREPQVSFYRAFVQRTPQFIAENIELLFLGRRTAQPQSELFFDQLQFKKSSEWKEEIVYVDLDKEPKTLSVKMALDGRTIHMKPHSDQRVYYVEWLTSPENREFARVMANRVWFWIMGRGVVDEPDDFSDDNTPSNPALLEYLTDAFIKYGYDVRALYREILLSNTYQTSSISTPQNREGGAELFAYYPTTRLTAEQLIDGISIITGVNDRYVSRVPEPYSYYPADLLSSDIGDASVSSPQLDLFGRPSRDNSMENQRSNKINSKQTLYLLNSNVITSKIASSRGIRSVVEGCADTNEVIEALYLMMLARYPSAEEVEVLSPMLAKYGGKQSGGEQLVWALINSSEFMFNH